MFSLQAMIQKYISRPQGRFYVLYIDFKKAFDSLVHYNIFKNILSKDANGKLIKVLISMYSK
jgi:hypothetical protein